MSCDRGWSLQSTEFENLLGFAKSMECVRVSVLTKGVVVLLAFALAGTACVVEWAGQDVSRRPASGTELDGGSVNIVNSLDYLPDGRTLAIASNDGAVGVWDMSRGRYRALRSCAFYTFLAAAPDGQCLAVSDTTRAIKLLDPHSGALRGVLEGDSGKPMFGRLAFSPDSRSLGAYQTDGSLCLFDLRGRRAPLRLRSSGGSVACLEFTPDSATLTTSSLSGVVEFWSVLDGRLKDEWRTGKEHPVFAYAADGKTLALGNRRETTVELYEVASRRIQARLVGHRSAIQSLAFSADGRLLATGAYDGEIKVWDVASRCPKHSFQGDMGCTWTMAFAPDGKMLAAGGEAKVRLWALDGRSEPKLATLRPVRPATEEAGELTSAEVVNRHLDAL